MTVSNLESGVQLALEAEADAARRWDGVDAWLADALSETTTPSTTRSGRATEAGLPHIAVSPLQGKLLDLLARMIGARSILEIGTLGGYSTIWLARALPPDGRLVSLEVGARATRRSRARTSSARASAALVDIRVGPALETLAERRRRRSTSTFIDADKKTTPEYFRRALELSRPGSVIVGDNVVRGGALVDEHGTRAARACGRFVELMAAEPRVEATVIQTVGVKGYDGFAVARVSA